MIHPVSRKTLSLPHRQTSHARSLSFFLSLRSFFILSSLSRSLAVSKPTLFLKQAFPISFRYFLFLLLAEDTKLSCFLHEDTNTLSQPYRDGGTTLETNKQTKRKNSSVCRQCGCSALTTYCCSCRGGESKREKIT